MSSTRFALNRKTFISLLILTVLIFPVYNNAQALSPTILYLDEPPSPIVVGQEIIFTGYFATVDDEVIEGAMIEVYAYDADENTQLIATAETDSNGEFQAAWTAEYLADYIGIFAYFAEQEDLAEAFSESYVVGITEEEPIPNEQVEISMIADKDAYAIGETVVVDAFLSPFVEGQEPYIIIYNGYGWVYSEGFLPPDPDGNFSFEFVIGGEDAIIGTWFVQAYYLDNLSEIQFEVNEGDISDFIEFQSIPVHLNGQAFDIIAGLSNGFIDNISINEETATLTVEMTTEFYDGDLIISIPRGLLDATTIDGVKDTFVIFDNEYETSYTEIDTTDVERTLDIYVAGGVRTIEIIGTQVASQALTQIETVVTLNEIPSRVALGETVAFTGSIYTRNNEAIEGALIQILNDDASKEYADVLASGLSDANGEFYIEWLAVSPDIDNKLLIYSYFEGGNSLDGERFTESFSEEEYEVAITEPAIEIAPQFPDAYMKLIGVWDKDPIRVAVINEDPRITDYEDDVKFAFEEWSRLLKEASGNNRAWNFEIVDSNTNIFDKRPDILVQLKLDDEGTECNQGGGVTYGYAKPTPDRETKRYTDTVYSVIFAGCQDQPFTHEIVRDTSIHELAHGFGLGHTFNKDGDLMCSVEDGVETCRANSGGYNPPSDLNIDAILQLYGNDGFAEPNATPVPAVYSPNDNNDFVYIQAYADKTFYAKGDIARITIEVFDSKGRPVDIEPSLIGVAGEVSRLETGKYSFETEVADGVKEIVITAGQSKLGLSISGGVAVIPTADEPKEPTTPISIDEQPPASSNSPNAQNGGGGCLIATAAFGSELTPQVQFLRNFRDNQILSTAAGSSFMDVFNAWYYSFSPYVADYERQQPWLQQTVRTSIYPLLGILQASEKAYSTIPGEYGALSAGFIASSLIGAVYLAPLAISIKGVRKSKFNYKLAACIIAVVSTAVLVAILTGNQTALMVTTSMFVLTIVSISAILSAKGLLKIGSRLLQNIRK